LILYVRPVGQGYTSTFMVKSVETFLLRDAMLYSAVYVVVVCPSVCPSHAGILSKRLGGSSCFLSRRLPSYPSLCFQYLQNKGTPLWYFVSNSGLGKFRHQVDRVANKTGRRSCLLTTLATVDASWLNVHSLLHVRRS